MISIVRLEARIEELIMLAYFKRAYLFSCVAIVSLMLSIGCAELLTRVYLIHLAPTDIFGLFADLSAAEKRPDALMHGVPRPHPYLPFLLPSNFQHKNERLNSLGYRGDDFTLEKPEGEFRILCVGGSTTYDDAIDDYRLSYPYQLERELSALGFKVRVINGGVPGYQSYDTLIRYAFLSSYLQPDLMINFDGVNDIATRMVWPTAHYLSDNTGFRAPYYPNRLQTFLRGSAFLNMVMVVTGAVEARPTYANDLGVFFSPHNLDFEFNRQLAEGTYPSGVFNQIAAIDILAENPPVYFKENLRHLIGMASSDGTKVVLMTFVCMSTAENSKGPGGRDFYFGITQNNDAVRRLALETSSPLIDLAELYPSDETLWADGIHNNERGAALKASIIAKELSKLNLLPSPPIAP